MSCSINDYRAIRARRDSLRRELDAAIFGEPDPLPEEWLTPEAADRKYGLPAASGEPKSDGS
jgi:hypothetical protein